MMCIYYSMLCLCSSVYTVFVLLLVDCYDYYYVHVCKSDLLFLVLIIFIAIRKC